MAFKNRNLNVIACANGFTLWHYKSNEETLKDITADNYFLPVKTLCAVGDIFMINAQDGTTIKILKELDGAHDILKLGDLA